MNYVVTKTLPTVYGSDCLFFIYIYIKQGSYALYNKREPIAKSSVFFRLKSSSLPIVITQFNRSITSFQVYFIINSYSTLSSR